jgi:hypothetical protein
MATNSLAVDIVAPQIAPPPFSLLSIANVIDLEDERRSSGLSFVPEGCGSTEVVSICANNELAVPTGTAGIESFSPFGLVAADRCSTFSFRYRDYVARATRKLIACESKLIEAELWAGDLGEENSIIASSNADVVGGGAVDASVALAYLEQAIADCGCGSRMMIHLRPWLFNWLIANAHTEFRYEGNRYYTPMGHIVVPGNGYLGTGPTGQPVASTEWMYATGLVTAYRWPISITPGSLAEATERRTNTVTMYAERAAGFTWDSSCCHLALEVNKS